MAIELNRESSEAEILEAYSYGAHPALIAEKTERLEEDVLALIEANEGNLPGDSDAPKVEEPVVSEEEKQAVLDDVRAKAAAESAKQVDQAVADALAEAKKTADAVIATAKDEAEKVKAAAAKEVEDAKETKVE